MNEDGFTVTVPDSMSSQEKRAYIQGLKDMAEYMQHVGHQAQQVYEAELAQEPDVENPCPDCGAEMIYDGTTGLRCPECDM